MIRQRRNLPARELDWKIPKPEGKREVERRAYGLENKKRRTSPRESSIVIVGSNPDAFGNGGSFFRHSRKANGETKDREAQKSDEG